MAMLTRLRGGHVNDFAGPPFDDDVPAMRKFTSQYRKPHDKRRHTSCAMQNTTASQKVNRGLVRLRKADRGIILTCMGYVWEAPDAACSKV